MTNEDSFGNKIKIPSIAEFDKNNPKRKGGEHTVWLCAAAHGLFCPVDGQIFKPETLEEDLRRIMKKHEFKQSPPNSLRSIKARCAALQKRAYTLWDDEL